MGAAGRRKYRREEKAKGDLGQTVLSPDGAHFRTRVIIQQEGVDLNKVVFCPFCLEENKVQRFLVSTKQGVSQHNAACPVCGVGFRLYNLLKAWTPETYADWVFEYRKSGFFQKINFLDWREKLYKMGWASAFWARYNALKGEEKDEDGESYADRMNRLGEEAAQQWTEAGETPDDYDRFPEY